MDKKQGGQGFFSALREEVARGLSPARARRRSASNAAAAAARRGCGGEALAPLMEGPDPDNGGGGARERRDGWARWVRGQLHLRADADAAGRNDLRLLLGVMGAPLAPVRVCVGEDHPLPHLSIKATPIETSSAQYIVQQYLAASGGQKLLSSVRNAYAMGKVRMAATEFEARGRVVRPPKNHRTRAAAEPAGRFVLWQMAPEMWYIELAVGGCKVRAGCDGRLVWRHTPWGLGGARAAKGPVRPLRRALQGLDPLTTASMFAGARCIGERKVSGEDCFVLKLSADPETLRARSSSSSEGGGPAAAAAEIIRHVMFGYFSQKTGLLVHLEDSHLTRRIHHHQASSASSDDDEAVVYWETTINTFLDEYRPVEGVTVAHSGRSAVTLFRFGETAAAASSRGAGRIHHARTRMEEAWAIEEVAFDVPGLSADCFIPPADICRSASVVSEAVVDELPLPPHGVGERSKAGGGGLLPCHSAKVAALEKAEEDTVVAWSGGALQQQLDCCK